MAKHTEHRPCPGHDVVTKTTCDLCGRNLNHVITSSYQVSDVTIEARVGTSYGSDGGDLDHYHADVCEACFLEKVVPALAAIGLQVTKTTRDW